MLLRSEFKTAHKLAHKSEQLQISSELLDEDKALRFAERGVEIFEMQTDGYGRVSGPEQKIIVHGFETTKLAISHRFESPFPMQPMTWREMGNAPPDHAESIFKSVEPKTSLTVSHVYHRWKNKVRKWQADYVLLIWCLASSGSSKEHGLNEDVLSCYTTGQAKDEEISLYVKAKGSIEISQILLRNKKKKRRSKYWRFKFNDKSMEHKLTTGLIVLIKQMIVTLSSVTCLGLN
ncbi:unnamed protein product [Brassica rapa]|uniref:Uncharacterized protein n=1 Tax=Brassica campestris TaxID=3711 RepID=A0A3P6BGL8_BRACM|nr:unnamed protein product [Brassica rapa]VDC98214.1 unnamed protein product [Brassica rapa]